MEGKCGSLALCEDLPRVDDAGIDYIDTATQPITFGNAIHFFVIVGYEYSSAFELMRKKTCLPCVSGQKDTMWSANGLYTNTQLANPSSRTIDKLEIDEAK